MFGEFHPPFQPHCCFLFCPLHAPPPSHHPHSVSVLGTQCAHSVNICCMDELVCAPSLCAFPQPGMSLSLPLFIWLTLPCEASTWAVILMTFALMWEGLGVSDPFHCSYHFAWSAFITSFRNYSFTYLFLSSACELLKGKDGIRYHWIFSAKCNAWTLPTTEFNTHNQT